MAKVKAPIVSSPRPRHRPALTPEARENQLTSAAYDLVEQRLLDGTASAQETVHFLKLASRKAKLEVERLALENKLIEAKTKQIHDQADMKALYENAIAAMRTYGGHGSDSDYDSDYGEEDDEYGDY